MAIVEPKAMDFSDKHIILILSGLPGTWKTTTACSAKNALLVDFDEGLARVNPEHRIPSSICKTYEEFLDDIKAAEGKFETIIIDTCGAMIEFMKDWAMRNDPKASKKDGGFSLQGYGIIKSEFLRLSAYLRTRFNVVFLFHESVSRNGDDGTFYELVVEGSARTLVYQPADLAGHLFVQNGKHYIGFTPTEQYSAKSAYGIKDVWEIPELKEDDPNDFLEKLFARVRKNLKEENAMMGPQQKQYEEVMARANEVIDQFDSVEKVKETLEIFNHLPHILTSEKECKAMFKKKCEALGIIWDKAKKAYVYKDAQ